MRGRSILVLVVISALAGWYFFRDYPIANHHWNLEQPGVAPMPATSPGMVSQSGVARSALNKITGNRRFPIPNILPRDPRFVRVASFNIEVFERDKSENLAVLQTLASLLAQFDVVAIQGVAATQSQTIGHLVDIINSSGRTYDFVLGPRVGRDELTARRFAFVFDHARVEVDKKELYTVEDPDDLLRWEPLVAWFRTRNAHPQDAFTFTLVNVETDQHEKERENSVLGGVFREVRNDQRQEDDVLLAGCFRMSCDQLCQQPNSVPNSDWAAFDDIPTTAKGIAQDDNIMSCRNFTDEFTGRTGVFDFLRQLNLSLDQAEEVSTHLPVWAEFSVREGGATNGPTRSRIATPNFAPSGSQAFDAIQPSAAGSSGQ